MMNISVETWSAGSAVAIALFALLWVIGFQLILTVSAVTALLIAVSGSLIIRKTRRRRE